jgi:hypothetical protein
VRITVSVVRITENNIRFSRIDRSYHEITRFQATEHAFGIILSLNPFQSLRVLLSIPSKHVLTDIRIIPVYILMVQAHLF